VTQNTRPLEVRSPHLWAAALILLLVPCIPLPTQAEERRIAFWWEEDIEESEARAARAGLEQLGEVIDLPAPAARVQNADQSQLSAQASAQVELAQSSYYEARFVDAAQTLREYVERSIESLAASGCFESLRHVLLWLGASLAKSERVEESVEWFTLALSLGLAEIDRALFPPEVTSAYDQARARLESATPRSVTLSLSPEDSALTIDGVRSSPSTGGELALTPGRHLLVAERRGFHTAARALIVGEEETTVSLSLTPLEDIDALAEVAALRREEALSIEDPIHLGLIAHATGAELIAYLDESGGLHLRDRHGASVPPPPAHALEAEEAVGVDGSPIEGSAPGVEPAPAWRRWWFWVSLVGGAALLATSVGLGIHYGADRDVTFTLVPPRN